MKLHEIIEINDNEHQKSVLLETMQPYKRLLKIYYENWYGTDDLILMITSVTNATTYGKIVPAAEFSEAVYAWMGVDYVDEEDTDSDEFAQYETICANSIALKDW